MQSEPLETPRSLAAHPTTGTRSWRAVGAAKQCPCRIPKWCSATCRNKAWQANHAPTEGPVRVVQQRVEVPTPAEPHNTHEWVELLELLCTRLGQGRIYKRDPARPGAGPSTASPRRHRAAHPGAMTGIVWSWSRRARPTVRRLDHRWEGSSGAQHGCALLPTRAHEGARGAQRCCAHVVQGSGDDSGPDYLP